jgi:hypothetical protein
VKQRNHVVFARWPPRPCPRLRALGWWWRSLSIAYWSPVWQRCVWWGGGPRARCAPASQRGGCGGRVNGRPCHAQQWAWVTSHQLARYGPVNMFSPRVNLFLSHTMLETWPHWSGRSSRSHWCAFAWRPPMFLKPVNHTCFRVRYETLATLELPCPLRCPLPTPSQRLSYVHARWHRPFTLQYPSTPATRRGGVLSLPPVAGCLRGGIAGSHRVRPAPRCSSHGPHCPPPAPRWSLHIQWIGRGQRARNRWARWCPVRGCVPAALDASDVLFACLPSRGLRLGGPFRPELA